jgi:hypothetical protein
MKDRVREMSISDVLAKVLAGDRCLFVEQFDADVAVIRLDLDHDVSQR